MNKLEKSRLLLEEIVGADSLAEFAAGLPVKIPSPDNYRYWLTKKEWGINIDRLSPDGRLDQGMIRCSEDEVYDAAAAFIVSSDLGRVQWRCGNISVDLPREMPEKPPIDTSIIAFLLGGSRSLLGGVMRFGHAWLFEWFPGMSDDFYSEGASGWMMAYLFGGVVYTFPLWTFLATILASLNFFALPEDAGAFWLLGGFFIGGSITATAMMYLGWKRYWERNVYGGENR